MQPSTWPEEQGALAGKSFADDRDNADGLPIAAFRTRTRTGTLAGARTAGVVHRVAVAPPAGAVVSVGGHHIDAEVLGRAHLLVGDTSGRRDRLRMTLSFALSDDRQILIANTLGVAPTYVTRELKALGAYLGLSEGTPKAIRARVTGLRPHVSDPGLYQPLAAARDLRAAARSEDSIVRAANTLAAGSGEGSRRLRLVLSAALSGDHPSAITQALACTPTELSALLRNLGACHLDMFDEKPDDIRSAVHALRAHITDPGLYRPLAERRDGASRLVNDDAIVRAANVIAVGGKGILPLTLSSVLSGNDQVTIARTLKRSLSTVNHSLRLLGVRVGLTGRDPEVIRAELYRLAGRITDPGLYRPLADRRDLDARNLDDDAIVTALNTISADTSGYCAPFQETLSAALSGDSASVIARTWGRDAAGVSCALRNLGVRLGLMSRTPDEVRITVHALRAHITDPGLYRPLADRRDFHAAARSDDSVVGAANLLAQDGYRKPLQLRLILSAALSGHGQAAIAAGTGHTASWVNQWLRRLGTALDLSDLAPDQVRAQVHRLSHRITDPSLYPPAGPAGPAVKHL
ncbi:hypothetical protein ACFYPT_41480 [Streptomyces sp. NPDC005529]|uniref:hypothetical protein n=1 Tax=unclassified Streptomyces TaxID=2593676 RepID=UPI0033A8E7BC